MTADMHTHSEYSHDSVCKTLSMLESQLSRGTEIFAVTDHLDVYSYNDYDIYTPIVNSNREAERLSEKYEGKILILSGYEVSEGFWFPEVYQSLKFDTDVVTGSVHCVRYPSFFEPYSRIDFSRFSDDEILSYLEAYFKDIFTLFDTTDFDVLAHLTCPLRYIVGKYSRSVDLKRFSGELSEILQRVIKEDKALEINTSSFDLLGDFMPGREIIERYYALGGRRITLGSDAHVAENASKNFDKALEFVKRVGFENIFYYKRRAPVALGL